MRKVRNVLIFISLLAFSLNSNLLYGVPSMKKFTPGMATISPLAKAPKIDGIFKPEEWDGAVGISRFLGIQGIDGNQAPNIKGYQGQTYLGFKEDKLYVAVISELPPDDKLLTIQTKRDGKNIFDDGIEMWIDPCRDQRLLGVDQSKLWHIQSIINSVGAIYDLQFKGVPNTGWNGDWKVANKIDKKTKKWIIELSLTLKSLGLDKNNIYGRSIGFLISRNFKRPWRQLTWFPHALAFVNYLNYPKIIFTKDAPSVQIQSVSKDLTSGQLDLNLTIFNPASAKKVKVITHIDSTDRAALHDEKIIDLPAKGSAAYSYIPPTLRLLKTNVHKVAINVESLDGKESYLKYNFVYRAFPKNWKVRTAKDGPDYASGVKFAYYPSFNMVRVNVDTSVLDKQAETIKKASVSIIDQDGKVLFNGKMNWKTFKGMKEFDIPDLPNGKYSLQVTLDNYKHVFKRSFKRVHFPWEGNTLGITNKIYPPFKPIKYNEKSKVMSVVLRDYKVGDVGFWESVKADGEEILAGPISLKVNGKALSGKGIMQKKMKRILDKYKLKTNKKGKRLFRPVFKNKSVVSEKLATYKGRISTPAAQITSICETEYDGCMKVTLKLEPGTDNKKKLDNLTFEIPIKDEYAKLYHVATTTVRVNPAGKTPEGSGKVWDSNDFPDGDWHGNFKCYMWVGGFKRGICWFADNDKGWELAYDNKNKQFKPCQELIRKSGVLTIKINLIQKPVLIDKPREIVFGIMATPAKPMIKNWRSIETAFSMSYFSDAVFSAKAPRNEDWTILDKMQEIRLGGKMGRFMDYWVPKHIDTIENKKHRQKILNLAKLMVNVFSSKAEYCSMYLEEFHSTSIAHEAARVFQSEWSGRNHVDYKDGGYHYFNGGNVNCGNIVDSYVDFACWNFAEQIRRGIGIYFDNSFPMQGHDLRTTTAYILPNGKIQPSAGIWARRKYLQRVWVMHQQLAPAATKPLMMVHMTNTHIIPYLVWNQSNLDLEWMFGKHPAQSRYPLDMLQAQSLGIQSGNIPVVLAYTQNRFHTHFIHEARFFSQKENAMNYVKHFGYGKEDCDVFNYWMKNYPVKVNDPQVKSILLKRQGKLLLIFSSWNPKKSNISFSFDQTIIGFSPKKVTDVYAEKEMPLHNGQLTLELPPYGTGMFELE